MAIEQINHKWNADRPVERPEDDALGRDAFARRIAQELGSWRQEESLVVSLNGEWGSGKTTVANLILYYINEQAASKKGAHPVVVKFNPWQWSGQDKLMEGFFDEIAAAFSPHKIGNKVIKLLYLIIACL